MITRRIHLSAPDIGPAERELVDRVLRSGQLSCGPVLDEFEHEFASRFGAQHAVAVSSGTAGLHLAMIASNVHDGDFVITSPFSFVATANSVLYERGIPLFVDIDPVTLNIDPQRAVAAIEQLASGSAAGATTLPRVGPFRGKLKAIIPVHIFGRIADMKPIMEAARAHGIAVVEDACEAIGATVDGIPAGRYGDLSVFAFYPNKQITTGEGGVVLTDDASTATLLRSLRNHGRGEDRPDGVYERLGFNYRLDDMSAALGLTQLRRLDEILASRERIAGEYATRLAGNDDVTPLAPVAANERLSWFVYPVRLDPSIDRDLLIERLAERGIASRAYFWPIHLQPYYRNRFGYQMGDFPHAEAAGLSTIALPFHTQLSVDDIDYVCSSLETEIATIRQSSTRQVR